MAKPLKTAGAAELEAFRKRLVRQFAMDRVKKDDYWFILERVSEIETRISEMWEQGEEDWS
jgi:hypothetical protein